MAKQPTKKRQLKTAEYKSFRVSKPIKHAAGKLPAAHAILKESLQQLLAEKKLFAAILGVFVVLYVVLVRGFAGSDLTIVKDGLQEGTTGGAFQATTGFGLFFYLLGTSATPESEVASLYQLVLLVVTSLAIIWAIRQVQANPKPAKLTMRSAYYNGNAPIIPFILVLVTIGVQLIPALVGTTVYQQVIAGGLATTSTESIVWLILMLCSLLLSFYMICSSLFALYIVTLPDIVPMQALRSARELVRYRRWEVMRKVLFLPFVLVLGALVICFPFLLYLTAVAEIIFFLYGVICIALTHTYMYQLYRKLL